MQILTAIFNYISIILGIIFLIGLYFLIDTVKDMSFKDFAILKNRKLWITLLILAIIFFIYAIMGFFLEIR